MKNIHKNDVIIHLAGIIDIKNNKKKETLEINYEGTKKILDISILKRIKRFIYFSTVDCIYKQKNELITEPTMIYPKQFIDNYSYSKALATEYVIKMREVYKDIEFNILYPSAVIGINDFKPSYIGQVVLDIINNKMQFGIKCGYNFIDVDDIANITEQIINKQIAGDFLLTGNHVTICEFYDVVNHGLKKKKKTVKIPLFWVYMCMPFVPYLSKFVLKTINENYNYDNSKIKKVLNYDLTNFEQTINKTIKFFKKEDDKNGQ